MVCNPNKKGGLFSRPELRGKDLNLRPLGYEDNRIFARSFASIIWLVLVHSCFLLFGRFCGRTCGRRFSEASKPNGTILILSGPKLRRLKFGKTWEAHHCLERCAPALVNFTLSAEAAADFESAATLREILRKPSSIANLPGFSSLRPRAI